MQNPCRYLDVTVAYIATCISTYAETNVCIILCSCHVPLHPQDLQIEIDIDTTSSYLQLRLVWPLDSIALLRNSGGGVWPSSCKKRASLKWYGNV